jgi:hypothetical protein
MTPKMKARIKIALLAIGFAVLFLLPILARGQAPRPPIQNLSGLTGDVNITTPLDLQPLRYDAATSKWINSLTLGDIVVHSSNAGLLTNVADFYNGTLMNKTGVAIDWSNTAGTEFPLPLIDGSGKTDIDVNARKLYKTDGSTVLFDWSGTNPKFPTLTNSASNAFLTTDASGNVSVAPVPNAGTIAVTTNLLQGDGAGNALSSNLLFDTIGSQYTFSIDVDDIIHWTVENGNNGTSAGADFVLTTNLGAVAGMRAYGGNYVTAGLISGGDASVFSAAGDLLLSGNGLIRFSNDGLSLATQRAQLGNGFSVGSTTDPGGGVVNVSSGFRINNAAPYNHSLIGNGVSYADGSVPGKASVTSTVDQTATTETAHVVYTVQANSAAVGTVYRIHASGNVDNGTTGITFTPRIRWGGTAGAIACDAHVHRQHHVEHESRLRVQRLRNHPRHRCHWQRHCRNEIRRAQHFHHRRGNHSRR